MPELAEVHCMVSYLKRVLPFGSPIQTSFHHTKVHAGIDHINGAALADVTRKAKYILFHTDKGILLCHNRFTGYWSLASQPWSFDYLEFKRNPSTKDIRATFDLNGDSLEFHDARLLGVLEFYSGIHDAKHIPKVAMMGPDVVLTNTTDKSFLQPWLVGDFVTAMKGTGQAIKLALLDQKLQAGIGNIYACEALWAAKINPFKRAKDVQDDDLVQLWRCVKDVLQQGINKNIKYDDYIKIFRADICLICLTKVTRSVQANRGTYWCENCQR
jgi:formamidopyrimidine-DNA glycosylase